MANDQDWQVGIDVLRASAQLVDGIQTGLARRGFTDVRPAHGFAFVRIAAGNATVVDVARHLGVSKQAASQLVRQLEALGYVERRTDPHDRRVSRLALTARGRACTVAAEESAAEVVAQWRASTGAGFDQVAAALAALVTPGPLRPSW